MKSSFPQRHIGPSKASLEAMPEVLGDGSQAEVPRKVVPGDIRFGSGLD